MRVSSIAIAVVASLTVVQGHVRRQEAGSSASVITSSTEPTPSPSVAPGDPLLGEPGSSSSVTPTDSLVDEPEPSASETASPPFSDLTSDLVGEISTSAQGATPIPQVVASATPSDVGAPEASVASIAGPGPAIVGASSTATTGVAASVTGGSKTSSITSSSISRSSTSAVRSASASVTGAASANTVSWVSTFGMIALAWLGA